MTDDVYDEIDKILRPNRKYDTNGQAVNTIRTKSFQKGDGFDTSFPSSPEPYLSFDEPRVIKWMTEVKMYPDGKSFVKSWMVGQPRPIKKSFVKKKGVKQVDNKETDIIDSEEY